MLNVESREKNPWLKGFLLQFAYGSLWSCVSERLVGYVG